MEELTLAVPTLPYSSKLPYIKSLNNQPPRVANLQDPLLNAFLKTKENTTFLGQKRTSIKST